MQSRASVFFREVSCKLDGQTVTSPLSLEISSSEFIGLIGKNGAGKTTLLRTLAGINRTYDGSIAIDGTDIRKLSQSDLAKRISFLPQRLEPFLSLSVEEVLLAGRFAHLNGAWTFSKSDFSTIKKVAERLGLEEFLPRKFGKLSSGEQQRVLVGSAICQEASFLVLDEPSAFLDPFQEMLLFETLRDLNVKDGVGIILASHNLVLLGKYASRIIALCEGKICFDGVSSFLKDDAFQTKVYGGKVPQ